MAMQFRPLGEDPVPKQARRKNNNKISSSYGREPLSLSRTPHTSSSKAPQSQPPSCPGTYIHRCPVNIESHLSRTLRGTFASCPPRWPGCRISHSGQFAGQQRALNPSITPEEALHVRAAPSRSIELLVYISAKQTRRTYMRAMSSRMLTLRPFPSTHKRRLRLNCPLRLARTSLFRCGEPQCRRPVEITLKYTRREAARMPPGKLPRRKRLSPSCRYAGNGSRPLLNRRVDPASATVIEPHSLQ